MWRISLVASSKFFAGLLVWLILLMSISNIALADPSRVSEPTGASLLFTSDDPIVAQARQLIAHGNLSQADALLKQTGGDAEARAQGLEIIRRIRLDFGKSAPQLLARLQQSIPGVTAGDLSRWTAAGQVQSRLVDGKLQYFVREPANVWRFCGEAKERRQTPKSADNWTLESHLERVIAEAQKTGRRQVVPIRHRVHYSLTVPADAPGFKEGAVVRAWLPFPQEYRQQTDVKLISTSPAGAFVAPSAAGENPLTGTPQRTVYFEQKISDAEKPLVFTEIVEFTSSAWYPILEDSQARPLPADWQGGSLGERPPHIVFTPEIRKTVEQIVGDESNPLIKARKIFHWIDGNIAYNSEMEYSTIPSLCTKAFTTRRGDCGVQTMLFITMCRCAGIPARWQSGWETKRIGHDMHDWCEIYIEPWGWLPCDPSYGLRKSDNPAVREFYLGHQDSYRMIVNRDYGCQFNPPKNSLRSEPLDFQRGEVEIDGKNLYFPNWDYDEKFEWLSEGP
jgi:transglutaminase-like putative cysteine protease